MSHPTRRGVIAGASSLAALSAGGAFAQSAMPASPVMLNIIDVAGNLQLTQAAIEKFAKDNPKLISRVNFSRAPSPELPAKLKAQQDANRVDIDMVLTGPGAMSDGIQQGLWIDVWKSHTAALPKAEEIYHEQALMMQRNFGQNEGVAVVYSPSGPLFEYAPDRLKTVPKTAEEFLAYVKQNPNRFTYARPLNSGPGWTFLQGLPYILGDSDPSDPMNGWAFARKVNPLSARLKALFSSDIGHWDVPVLADVAFEEHEGVRDGILSPEDFRRFTFEHPAHFWTSGNPAFFDGTRVERAVRDLA